MTKKILIPVDTSQLDAAHAAMNFAKSLFKDDVVEFTFFNVLPYIPAYVAAEMPDDLSARLHNDAKDVLKKFAADLGVADTAHIAVREGNAGREILDFAAEIKPDLILMSSHDPGLADYILGSNAAHVVRHAHCSVLIVRNLGK